MVGAMSMLLTKPATYKERLDAHFALSGCTLVQPINNTYGDGIYYQLPGETYMNGSSPTGRLVGWRTERDAKVAALHALGVDLDCDRWDDDLKGLGFIT